MPTVVASSLWTTGAEVREFLACRRAELSPEVAGHAVGQTLHVTEGVGLVGTRDGTVFRIHAGETVLCPPDEEHWHGAAADTFMSHLAMLEVNPDGSDPTTWLEPLPDDEYRKAD